MDTDFWHRKWENNEIGFHESVANPLLVKHLPALSVADGGRVFLPLCGKTLDIHWLLAQGYQVAGAELSTLAIQQLFAELGTEPTVTPCGPVERYSAPNLDVLVGDFFQISGQVLGPVDAIYDRAALVALSPALRSRYTTHLIEVTALAPQLLICYEYDQSLMAGPPFAIASEEVLGHYRDRYEATLLDRVDIPGGFKGKFAAQESVWRLARPRGSRS